MFVTIAFFYVTTVGKKLQVIKDHIEVFNLYKRSEIWSSVQYLRIGNFIWIHRITEYFHRAPT